MPITQDLEGVKFVDAGTYPPALLEVCNHLDVDPSGLLDWSVGKYSTVVILASGAKVRIHCMGDWKRSPDADGAVKHLPPPGSFDPPAKTPRPTSSRHG